MSGSFKKKKILMKIIMKVLKDNFHGINKSLWWMNDKNKTKWEKYIKIENFQK